MDAVQRLAGLDAIAELLVQPDAGALVERSPRCSGQPVEMKTVDPGDDPIRGCADICGEIADLVGAKCRSLCIDDLLHLAQRGAASEQFTRTQIAGASAQGRVVLEQMARQPQ